MTLGLRTYLKIVPIRVESRRMKQLLLIAGLISATCPALSFAAEAAPAAGAAAPAAAAAAPPTAATSPDAPPPPAKPQPKAALTPGAAPQIQVVTSVGSFTLELNPERAPLT